MKTVAWIHDEALRHWFHDDPAIYVFDDERLQRERWSLKRIGFIYECLLELPVEIRRGDPVSEVLAFQQSHHADGVRAMITPDPWLKRQMHEMQADAVLPEDFVTLSGKVNLRRFSRYWKAAEKALRPAATLSK